MGAKGDLGWDIHFSLRMREIRQYKWRKEKEPVGGKRLKHEGKGGSFMGK